MIDHHLYSVDDVADLLGLHVKTVRGYVRDGRLKATRIGKQYRIARPDLEAFTGQPAAAPARETVLRQRHVEVSSIVQVDAIDPGTMSRLANLVGAAVTHGRGGAGLRVETIYDEERAVLKIVILGAVDRTAEVLRIIGAMLADRP